MYRQIHISLENISYRYAQPRVIILYLFFGSLEQTKISQSEVLTLPLALFLEVKVAGQS